MVILPDLQRLLMLDRDTSVTRVHYESVSSRSEAVFVSLGLWV